MAEFRIRAAVPSDTEGIVNVVRAVYDEYGFTWQEAGYHADLYDVAGHFFSRGHSFFVAECAPTVGRSVVGTVALRLFPSIEGPPRVAVPIAGKLRIADCDCSLDRLYVHPDFRRRGIGIALARHVVDAAARDGRRVMEIWSDKRFVEAHRLYGRLGAVSIAERVLDDPDNSPEWGLALDLPDSPYEPQTNT